MIFLAQNYTSFDSERAYHGHTTSTVNISPYKFDGKGGKGKPSWVHVVPCPDTYRSDDVEDPARYFAGTYGVELRKRVIPTQLSESLM